MRVIVCVDVNLPGKQLPVRSQQQKDYKKVGYMLKFINKNKVCFGVFNVTFVHISNVFLMLLLLNLNR